MANFQNNFQNFENEFNAVTGLNYITNIDTYIQYVQARILDEWMQQQEQLMNELIAEVKKISTV
jgi:hypothetical protein